MKYTKIILSIIMLCALIISGCAAQEEPVVEEIAAEPSQVMASINTVSAANVESSQNIQLSFNLDLLKKLSADKENLFYSSFSINQALTMAYFGANGATQEEIKNTLGYENLSLEDIAGYQKYLLDVYADSGDTTFYSANSLWIDDGFPVKDEYIAVMKDNFEAEVSNVDLSTQESVGIMNKWIESKTNGMINKLFDEPLGDMAALVLMNAIYFNGQWTLPFDPANTNTADFYGIDGTQDIEMMFLSDDVQGYEGDDYKAVSLNYGEDERFKFVAVLPDGDINEYIAGLDADSLSDVLTTFQVKNGATVLIPKFEMEQTLNLNETLKALGIQTAFTGDADFSEISDIPLAISDVLHKAKIKVDEEGTEAAAVTAITFKATAIMPGQTFEFIADSPFIYFIMDSENDTVLFTGVMFDSEFK